MPVHDWSRVEAGILHHFHHSWIEELQRALNHGVLPKEYYALAEQHAAGLAPDVLTLESMTPADSDPLWGPGNGNGSAVMVAEPRVSITAETDMEFYRRKQNVVAIKHITGDRTVAVIEVVSKGNKAARAAMQSFVEKAAELLEQRIHLLILDLHPPGTRDPQGIHGVIWEYISAQEYQAPPDKPLTLVAYESGLTVRAFIEPLAVGDRLPDMPLFLEPGAHVLVPLEATYDRAFAEMPRQLQRRIVE